MLHHPLHFFSQVFAAVYLACVGAFGTPDMQVSSDDARIIRAVVSDFIDAGLYRDEFTMASGFRLQNGQDFDDIFMLRGSATPGAVTGYKTSDGNDINQKYYPSGGSDLPIYNTGYKVAGGDDVRTKFRRRAFVAGVNPPVINSITNDSPKAIGQMVTMSVTVTGPSLNYQWFKGTTEISGATSASYSFTAAGASDSAVYSCNVWNGGGSVRSSTKVVVTTSATGAPTITQITSNSPQAVGSFITITVTATGDAPLSYSWFGPRGYISGANKPTYSFVASEASQMGAYTCVVSNVAGLDQESTNITISGISAVPVINYITSTVTECWETDTVGFSVAASGAPPLTYQWYYPSGSPVSGATSASLDIQITSTSQEGNWSCTVTNSAGSDSESIYLTVYALPDPPVINSLTATNPAYLNHTVTFTANVTGTIQSDYWTGPAAGLAAMSGAYPTWSFNANHLYDFNGTYTYHVENLGGSDSASVSITVEVYPAPSVTVNGPSSVLQYHEVTFTTSVTGEGPFTYQWRKDSIPISGATSSSYTFTPTNWEADSASYSCYVTDGNGTGIGSKSLTVLPYSSPSASVSGSATVAVGGGGGGSWDWSVSCHSNTSIYRYRVYISGQTGGWTYPGSGTTSASGTVNWTSPLGSPDISNTTGNYTWICDVEDNASGSDSDTADFTVE